MSTAKDILNYCDLEMPSKVREAVDGAIASKIRDFIDVKKTEISSNMGSYFEGYEPNTPDEAKFINMHMVTSHDYPVANEHGLPFRDDRIEKAGPQHKKPASYEHGQDKAVYTGVQQPQ